MLDSADSPSGRNACIESARAAVLKASLRQVTPIIFDDSGAGVGHRVRVDAQSGQIRRDPGPSKRDFMPFQRWLAVSRRHRDTRQQRLSELQSAMATGEGKGKQTTQHTRKRHLDPLSTHTCSCCSLCQ